MAEESQWELIIPAGQIAPTPTPAPKKVVVKPVAMPQPAAAVAPDPLVAAMQTRNATAAAAAAAPVAAAPIAAAPAIPPMPPAPKQQAGEPNASFRARMLDWNKSVEQMKLNRVTEAEKAAREAEKEAAKAAREAAAPKVGDLSAFSAKEQKLKDFEGYLADYKNELGKNLTVFPTKIPLIPSQGIEIPLPVGSDTARMQAKYNSLLMGVKDAYQLGALTGPDMSIVEAQITNPASMSGMLYSKEAFDEQVKVLEGLLGRAKTNLETSYGRKMSYPASGQGAQPSAAQNNDPMGLRRR